MIKLMTQCRNIATVFALSFSISLLSQAVVAQESLDSYPTLGPQSVLDLSDQSQVPDDLNVLTRGPLHEAFASAHQADPQPSALVFKTPPELIDEVPPEYKPEGNNVKWISGYWAWDDAQSDFIWISGVWRDVPPNRRWVPGYWDAEGDGHRWVSGIWTEETQVELGYLPQPPASIDQGPSTTAPGEEYFYVPGNWAHQNGNYRWLSGHWQPVIENWIWIPARYVWTPNGCVYQSGYWDYEVQNRGTCFAPVQFTQPVYLANTYSYRPSYAINLNVDFMTHLFVRPRCGHYFYGDWYASSFNNVSYRPWVSYSSHFRNYDPLLTYYRCRRSSFDSRYNVVQYLTRQHNFYVNNRDYRPRPTYKSQHRHANHIKHLHVSGSKGNRRPHEDYLRKSSYVRTYKDLRKHDDRRDRHTVDARSRGVQQSKSKKHHKVAEKELRDTRRNVEYLAKVQRERKRQELSGKSRDAWKQNGRGQSRNSSPNRQREQEQARQARERAQQKARLANQQQEKKQRDRDVAQRDRDRRAQQDSVRRAQEQARRTQQQQLKNRSSASRNTSGKMRMQNIPSIQQREQAARQAQQDLARKSRQQSQRDAARKAQQKSQQDLARRAQQEKANRAQQESARRAQEQARRNLQQQQQSRISKSRNTSGKMRMQNIPSIQQREQALRQAQQDLARKARQQSQRDAARKAQQKSQQDQARRAQQEQARRAQQDQARKAQQAAANRAKVDQARRAQQRAQQERSRQQAAQRAKQQQAQRDAARKAQQSRAKASQQSRKPPQQSRSSRLRNRSQSKKK